MTELSTIFMSGYNYWGVVILMGIGLYAMIAKTNLIKKIIGMNIFQTAIILFYVSISTKYGASIPIIAHGHGSHDDPIRVADYMNPLPHVLMLTAIVVSVATLGVALALAVRIYRGHGSLEEDEIIEKLKTSEQNQL
ncbi:MAG: cation:proton antiporter subunit C [Desulfosudaceae bacterium]